MKRASPAPGAAGVRSLLAMALPVLAASACMTTTRIEERIAPLEKLLADHHDSIYACSPKALARAEVALARARHESSRGRPVSARTAVEDAEAAVRDAWKGSGDTACLPDADGDDIPDRIDKCSKLAEDFDGFQDDDGCPDPDNDVDGVPDKDDQCPLEPGTPANRGCPIKDADGDGVWDKDDACPTVVGPRINRGCPIPDADKDGVPDDEDKCPNEAGSASNSGCPVIEQTYKLITIVDDQIRLRQKIFFQTAKATIKKESFELLTEVATALADHPKFRVRIEGHTDSVGNPKANRKLSQSRADSVRKYLIGKGVEATRLVAVGLGDEVPLDDNATEAGRAVNRRVEFHILER